MEIVKPTEAQIKTFLGRKPIAKPTEAQIKTFLVRKPRKIPDDAWLIDMMACETDYHKIAVYNCIWEKLYK